MRTPALACAVLVPALAVASVLVAPARDASAKPEFAKKEGKDCAFCHVNPRGSGPRNAKGIEYQRNGFKFLTPGGTGEGKGYGEDKAFRTEANGKAYGYVLAAVQLEHWADALRRIADLKSKEDKKGAGAAKLSVVESTVDGHGRDLVRAAREAIQGGKVDEAAAAIARVETEFKNRDPAKDIAKLRADLLKIAGGKEADVKAKADEPQRLKLLDAKMKSIEGDNATSIRLLQDLIAKAPDGPFAAEAKTKLEELQKPADPAPAMGG